jgi:hypothetical protein
MRGPFKYDLFAVSNHMGSLSSGHCGLQGGTGAAGLARATYGRRPSYFRHRIRSLVKRVAVLR